MLGFLRNIGSTGTGVPRHQWPWVRACLQKTVVVLWLLLSSTSLAPTQGQTKIPLET